MEPVSDSKKNLYNYFRPDNLPAVFIDDDIINYRNFKLERIIDKKISKKIKSDILLNKKIIESKKISK